MEESGLKTYIKKVTPDFIWNYMVKRNRRKNINYEFADFILDSAIKYSKHLKGDSSSFDSRLRNLIKNGDGESNLLIQDILTAFMPDYRNNLFQFYKNQEYLIFYRFLTYPYWEDMSRYIIPYEKSIAKFKNNDILDYGAGIPYGIIHSLWKKDKSINSVTLIDLDLIHIDFAKFLLNRIAPSVKLTVHKLTNPDYFPVLDGEYNFFYGKDIFEHLNDPLGNLKELIKHSSSKAICYFDFQDYGERVYQHVTPNTKFLHDEMIKAGFERGGNVKELTEFHKNL